MTWSHSEYCDQQVPVDLTVLTPSAATFLQTIGHFQHPFCVLYTPESYGVPGIPAQGPILGPVYDSTAEQVYETVRTVVPSLLSLAELLFRLQAAWTAPVGLVHLNVKSTTTVASDYWILFSTFCVATDELYRIEYGNIYGLALFVATAVVLLQPCSNHNNTNEKKIGKRSWMLKLTVTILAAWIIVLHMTTCQEDRHEVAGLFYDTDRAVDIYNAWQGKFHYYDDNDTQQPVATRWMTTGDARTAFPFILNRKVQKPDWQRVWLPVQDGEVVALDVAFPVTHKGKFLHRTDRPVYIIYHGLHGGSGEGYVQDMAGRLTKEGSTMVVMVARGLIDLPLRKWNVYNGARWSDANEAAWAVRTALGDGQFLAGIGYSMGAIIMSNFVGRSGLDCPLDAAVAISGGLDMRFAANYTRARRLWQPIIASALRDKFIMGKFGERVAQRLTKSQLKAIMRARDISAIDVVGAVHYVGYRDLHHYYSELSLLGDVTAKEYHSIIAPDKRVHNVSVPLLVIHSLDDPLSSWRTSASHVGAMHPQKLTKTGNGNLFVFLTRKGGHVGWPLGWLPHRHKWKYMNELAVSFVDAVAVARPAGTRPPVFSNH